VPATAHLANLIITAYQHGAAYQGPATIYLALVTDNPSATVAGTEVTDAAYARESFAQSGFTNDGAGGLTNTAAIVWSAVAAADYTLPVVALEAYDAATDGNRLWYEYLDVSVTIIEGQAPRIGATELSVTLV
jgi:hypothetical protein